MTFSASLKTSPGLAVIELVGDLDSATAPEFRQKVELASVAAPQRLVLDMTRLEYLSSAGLRGLVYARQKMLEGSVLELVAPTPAVSETIRLTGFDRSVTISDRAPL